MWCLLSMCEVLTSAPTITLKAKVAGEKEKENNTGKEIFKICFGWKWGILITYREIVSGESHYWENLPGYTFWMEMGNISHLQRDSKWRATLLGEFARAFLTAGCWLCGCQLGFVTPDASHVAICLETAFLEGWWLLFVCNTKEFTPNPTSLNA